MEAADLAGSTEYIVKVIEESPAGTIWAVGTEVNLVKRLAKEHPDKTIFCLDPVVCPCSTMYRIHPAYLAWVLESLVEGKVINQVTVDDGDGALGQGRPGAHAGEQGVSEPHRIRALAVSWNDKQWNHTPNRRDDGCDQ